MDNCPYEKPLSLVYFITMSPGEGGGVGGGGGGTSHTF